MRQERIIQANLFEIFATHEIGRELKQISGWLDQHRPLLRLVSNDLRRDGVCETRPAWPARGGRAALRAAETIPPVELRRTGVSPGRLQRRFAPSRGCR